MNFQTILLKKFNNLFSSFSELYHSIALKMDFSDSEFFILYSIALYEDEDCFQKNIVYDFHISKQTINSAIKKLEKEGYIYLEKVNGKDKKIILTDIGKQVVNEKVIPLIEYELNAFEEMDRKEIENFIKSGEKYLKILKNKIEENEEKN